MNAYELHQAAFDSAQEEFIPDDREGRIEYVVQYADGAMNVRIDRQTAETIVDAQAAYAEATWGKNGNGEYSNNAFYLLEKPLSEIEV